MGLNQIIGRENALRRLPLILRPRCEFSSPSRAASVRFLINGVDTLFAHQWLSFLDCLEGLFKVKFVVILGHVSSPFALNISAFGILAQNFEHPHKKYIKRSFSELFHFYLN